MKYKHLFFDLDHTLWDFEGNSRAVLKALYEKHNLADTCGIRCCEEFQKVYEGHNERFWMRFRNGYISREDLRWKRMWHTLLDFKKYDQALTKALSEDYIQLLPKQSKLMPYAQDILTYFRDKGFQLHIITNGYELVQWQKMKVSGIDSFFQQVVTSENSMSMKPKPDIFHYALKMTNAKVEESLMIGDALEADILGAQSVGMDQVYFNVNKTRHDAQPTYEISCLSALQDIIK